MVSSAILTEPDGFCSSEEEEEEEEEEAMVGSSSWYNTHYTTYHQHSQVLDSIRSHRCLASSFCVAI